MINKKILKQIIIQQKNVGLPVEETVKRGILSDVLQWFKDNRIIILTGIRRSGKSTLLKQIMQNKTDYCYVNFEDERFIDFRANEFEQLNEVLVEIYGSPKIYFFDEIQSVDKFEAFVRRIQDQGKKIVITGSNATLLSKEMGTKLTGRYKPFEVYPFSFAEYLSFRKVKPKKEWCYITEKKVELIKLFEDYINKGGMPEYLKNNDTEYIKTMYENILYKDIIARYSIRKQKILKELVSILVNNIASLFTYNSLKKDLGLANSITVKEYISYLSNSYLFFELQKFDFSIRKQMNLPKKIYIIDLIFSQVLGMNFSANKGKMLENVVFIELKRRNKEVYYYSNKNECDFLIKEGTKVAEAVQVCYDLNKSNKEREISGLLEAMNKFKLKKGVVLTHEQEEELKINGKKIKILPAWKWMLGFNN
jgi:hypothetical protein